VSHAGRSGKIVAFQTNVHHISMEMFATKESLLLTAPQYDITDKIK